MLPNIYIRKRTHLIDNLGKTGSQNGKEKNKARFLLYVIYENPQRDESPHGEREPESC